MRACSLEKTDDSERLAQARIEPWTGSVYDNALAETINGLYKAGLIQRRAWRTREQVKPATLDHATAPTPRIHMPLDQPTTSLQKSMQQVQTHTLEAEREQHAMAHGTIESARAGGTCHVMITPCGVPTTEIPLCKPVRGTHQCIDIFRLECRMS